MLRFLVVLLFTLTTHANAMERVDVGQIRFAEAALTIVGTEGEKTYDPAALEALGTYTMDTVTPWRDASANFVGVRLVDLLHLHGIADVSAIKVVAENDFAVTIERESWTDHEVMIATRVDGKSHSRRARGPLQFVYNMTDDPTVGATSFEKNWVWMAARIEVAE